MSLLRRIADLFVVPPEGEPTRADASPVGAPPTRACAVPPPCTPPTVALLAPPGDAPALGAALCLGLVRHDRARAGLVCVWSPAVGQPPRPLWRAPALPAARRLMLALAMRGHDAHATGRLAVVRLAAACEAGAAEAVRASAAAGDAPVVLALAGPRVAVFEDVLAAQDLVVVALARDCEPALAQLAITGLERGLPWSVVPSQLARSLAAAGIALLPSARRALAGPLAGLR